VSILWKRFVSTTRALQRKAARDGYRMLVSVKMEPDKRRKSRGTGQRGVCAIRIVDLTPFETECHRCDCDIVAPFGTPVFCWPFYEEFVHTESAVYFGYVPVCKTCHDWLVANEHKLWKRPADGQRGGAKP
jgi:hypothetical protein